MSWVKNVDYSTALHTRKGMKNIIGSYRWNLNLFMMKRHGNTEGR